MDFDSESNSDFIESQESQDELHSFDLFEHQNFQEPDLGEDNIKIARIIVIGSGKPIFKVEDKNGCMGQYSCFSVKKMAKKRYMEKDV